MKNEKFLTLLKILGVFTCLYLFLIGIGGIGAAFKGEFKETAAKLLEATQSPIVGLFIGILATTIVQSSSTTTSLLEQINKAMADVRKGDALRNVIVF